MKIVLVLATLLAVAACADARRNTVTSPQLDSGVTASRGGGEQTLGNQPRVGVTTQVR